MERAIPLAFAEAGTLRGGSSIFVPAMSVGTAAPGALAAFVAFYAQFQLEYWDTGQPESFAGVAVAWALVLAARAEDASASAERNRFGFAVGLVYALAGLFKPHLGAGLAVSAWVICAAARRAGHSPWLALAACSAGAAAGLPPGSCEAYCCDPKSGLAFPGPLRPQQQGPMANGQLAHADASADWSRTTAQADARHSAPGVLVPRAA